MGFANCQYNIIITIYMVVHIKMYDQQSYSISSRFQSVATNEASTKLVTIKFPHKNSQQFQKNLKFYLNVFSLFQKEKMNILAARGTFSIIGMFLYELILEKRNFPFQFLLINKKCLGFQGTNVQVYEIWRYVTKRSYFLI